jgi:hypothetical protein
MYRPIIVLREYEQGEVGARSAERLRREGRARVGQDVHVWGSLPHTARPKKQCDQHHAACKLQLLTDTKVLQLYCVTTENIRLILQKAPFRSVHCWRCN